MSQQMILKYEGQTHYELEICGLRRQLPMVKIGPDLWIASFVMMGDTELVDVCGGALASRLKKYRPEWLVAPEAKALPLVHTVASCLSKPPRFINYVACRKSIKGYMQNPLISEVKSKSITTLESQKLVLDGPDAAKLKGKRVALIDDVVSTGGTMEGMEKLIRLAKGEVVVRAAVLLEGDNWKESIQCLGYLPIFRSGLMMGNK